MFGGVGGGGMGGYMMPAGGFWIQTVLDKTAFTEASRHMAMLGTEMKILGRDFMIAGGLIASPMVLAAKEASRATVIQRAFNAVFREGTSEANRYVNSMARSTGRFTTDLQESLMSIQALFRGLNFGDKSTGMAQFTQGLMTDLAAFRGLTDQDVMQRFVSTLSGSVEAMDQLGIDVHEHAIQQELLAMGINKTVQEASEQEKIVARLNVIFKAMGEQGAIGAANRAIGEFDGDIIQLTTSLKNLQKSVGESLKPFLEGIIPSAVNITNAISEWVELNPQLVQGIGSVAASLAVLGATLWTTGAAVRVAAFGLGVFMNPLALSITGLSAALGMWATNAALAGTGTRKLTGEIQAFLDIVPGRNERWDALDILRDKIDTVSTRLLEAQLTLRDGPSFFDLLLDPSDEALASFTLHWQARVAELRKLEDSLRAELKEREGEILGEQTLGGISDAIRIQSADIGRTVEDDIAQGIQKGFLRGMEGTFSALSQRMFANRFSESIGEEIGGSTSGRRASRLGALGGSPFGTGREIGQAGPEVSLSGFGEGVTGFEGLGETGNRQRRIAEINRRRAARGLPPIEDRYSQPAEELPHEAYMPPEGYSYREQGLPEQYRPGPEGAYSNYTENRPGPNNEPGYWEMQYGPHNIPGQKPTYGGRFVPEFQGPYIHGNSQGATEFPVAPSLEDQPGLGAFGGGRPADPWAAEPRYREDTSLINEVREQVKGMESVKEAILDLISTLSNPETFQQRYE